MDLIDVFDDGSKGIAVATSAGMVTVLDSRCEPLWSKRLLSPATVLKSVNPVDGEDALLVVGCEDGEVVALDATGGIQGLGSVVGRPVCIASCETSATDRVIVLATDRGEAKAFRLGD
jgi:outer membrane protein assembly factor BamB